MYYDVKTLNLNVTKLINLNVMYKEMATFEDDS